jgi:chromosome partitioning protein
MPAYVITVAQQKGGVGKSTLAAHLAVAFAQQGYSTMLFDTDPQGTVTHWHAQRKSNDIGLIATSGWRLTRDLSMARESNDVIIIDTPPHAEMDIKVSVRAADMVIVPIQPSPADVWAVKETFNTISGESRQCMVVLNRVVQRANITIETKQKLRQLDIPVAETEIGNRVLFAASMENGLTVLDGFANPSQVEITNLVRDLAAKIGLAFKGRVTSTSKSKGAAVSTSSSSNTQSKDNEMATAVKKKAAPAKKPAAKKAAPKKAAAKPAVKKAAVKKAAPKKVAVKKAAPKKVAAKPAVKKAAPKKAAAPKKVAVKKAAPKKAAPKKAAVKKSAPKTAQRSSPAAQLTVYNGITGSKKKAA